VGAGKKIIERIQYKNISCQPKIILRSLNLARLERVSENKLLPPAY